MFKIERRSETLKIVGTGGSSDAGRTEAHELRCAPNRRPSALVATAEAHSTTLRVLVKILVIQASVRRPVSDVPMTHKFVVPIRTSGLGLYQ
jgi:hypothetical protein